MHFSKTLNYHFKVDPCSGGGGGGGGWLLARLLGENVLNCFIHSLVDINHIE